jgi:hypothetical protein
MMVESLADLASWWIVVLAAQSVNVSVIFVAVLLLTRVMRRLEPSLHLVLWSLVFVRLLLPPGLTHPWSVGALMDRAFPKDVAVGSRDVGGMEAVAAGMPAGIGVPTGDLQMRHGSAGLAVFWLVGAAPTPPEAVPRPGSGRPTGSRPDGPRADRAVAPPTQCPTAGSDRHVHGSGHTVHSRGDSTDHLRAAFGHR